MMKTPGDYHQWVQVWAIESVRIASLAFGGITFGMPEFDTDQRLMRINEKFRFQTLYLLKLIIPASRQWR